MYILYKTTNLINGRHYIGQHKCKSLAFDGYLGLGVAIKSAIKKYGSENFLRETLAVFDSRQEVSDAEREYVSADYLLRNTKVCYNTCVGGDGGFVSVNGSEINISQLPRVREKLRISSLEVHNRPDIIEKKRLSQLGEKNHRFGKPLSDKHKLSISQKLKGRIKPDSERNNISKALTGRVVPKCVGDKISAALKGRKITDEHRQKMRESQMGRVHPESVKQKISASHIGMTYPEVCCPYCGLVGRGGNMSRYHFGNCKHKEAV